MAAAALALVSACQASRPATAASPGGVPVLTGNETGATDPQSAVRGFLAAVKAQDLQTMGAIWGGPNGPARDMMEQKELFEREIVMICALKHDRFDIVSEAQNATGGQSLAVNLFAKNDNQVRTFDVVQGPKNRWYVRSIDLKTLGDCGKR